MDCFFIVNNANPALIQNIVDDQNFTSAQNMKVIQSEIDSYFDEDQQGLVHSRWRNGLSQNRI